MVVDIVDLTEVLDQTFVCCLQGLGGEIGEGGREGGRKGEDKGRRESEGEREGGGNKGKGFLRVSGRKMIMKSCFKKRNRAPLS